MDDLISRHAAIDLLKDWSGGYDYIETGTEDAIKDFQELPTVDAVPVIRCKDCKHWNGEVHDGFYYFEECAVSGLGAISDDYCSRAERKEG